MPKIKILTDSASDITAKDAKGLEIEILNIGLEVDGKLYRDRKDFTPEQYHTILKSSKTPPIAKAVSREEYLDAYTRALDEGFSHVIVVTMDSGSGSTFENARTAREKLYEVKPDAGSQIGIYLIDSQTHSMAYGYPIIQAAKLAKEGTQFAQILAYLGDWFSTVEIHLGVLNLEQAKKRGQVKAGSALIGSLLSVKPIVSIIEGRVEVVDQVRGEKAVAPRLLESFQSRCKHPDSPVFVISGQDKTQADTLAELIAEKTGRPTPVFLAGAGVLSNVGSRPLGLVFHGAARQTAGNQPANAHQEQDR